MKRRGIVAILVSLNILVAASWLLIARRNQEAHVSEERRFAANVLRIDWQRGRFTPSESQTLQSIVRGSWKTKKLGDEDLDQLLTWINRDGHDDGRFTDDARRTHTLFCLGIMMNARSFDESQVKKIEAALLPLPKKTSIEAQSGVARKASVMTLQFTKSLNSLVKSRKIEKALSDPSTISQ